ncbi:NAD(P)-dependent oxidoreductase [Saccharothrix sp. Mg75]|uniref:NAD(P)-dependent oxidoreductase n=1 Tax=Saccharothrix sp. Mg75 TaxID=3445357 RepID=UPI003EEE247F
MRRPARGGRLVAMVVVVLGTGLLGAGMARSLLRAGLDVVVWNRSPERARALAADGARVAEDAGEAVTGADVVVTVLFDLSATAEVMVDALPRMRDDAVWVQCGTVGVEGAERLADLAATKGVGYVDAPVLGTRQPAEQGALTVLAAGAADARDAVAPVFEAIGSRTVWVGDHPGDGQRLKLVANSWVLTITAAAAQAVALARGLGLDPAAFLDAIRGGAVDSPYAHAKGGAMIDGTFEPPSFGLDGAVKDAALIADALASVGADDRLMRLLQSHYASAVGEGDEDMAAVVRAFGA